MKYLVIKHTLPNGIAQEAPFIFSIDIEHKAMFEAVKALLQPDAKVASAGQIDMVDVYCGGASTSMSVESRPKHDRELIKYHHLTHGLVL